MSARQFAATSWAWLSDYPSTNARIYASTVLASLYVLVVVGCLAARRPLDVDVMTTVQWFLLVMMGLDVAQFVGKRATHKPDAPAAPDATDGAA